MVLSLCSGIQGRHSYSEHRQKTTVADVFLFVWFSPTSSMITFMNQKRMLVWKNEHVWINAEFLKLILGFFSKSEGERIQGFKWSPTKYCMKMRHLQEDSLLPLKCCMPELSVCLALFFFFFSFLFWSVSQWKFMLVSFLWSCLLNFLCLACFCLPLSQSVSPVTVL